MTRISRISRISAISSVTWMHPLRPPQPSRPLWWWRFPSNASHVFSASWGTRSSRGRWRRCIPCDFRKFRNQRLNRKKRKNSVAASTSSLKAFAFTAVSKENSNGPKKKKSRKCQVASVHRDSHHSIWLAGTARVLSRMPAFRSFPNGIHLNPSLWCYVMLAFLYSIHCIHVSFVSLIFICAICVFTPKLM